MPTEKETTAIERGKRLRICRDYTGLNIKEFCQKHGFNTITFGRWENGNKVSLNDKNVDRVCHALLKEGVICTRTWLLEGTGKAPMEKNYRSLLEEKIVDANPKSLGTMLIFSEMEIFQENYENAVTMMMNDSSMEPFYEENDHIGGIKLAPAEYNLAHKKHCLVKIPGSNKILLRAVQCSGQKIILTATNPSPSCPEPIILDELTKPEFLAPVVFHRKDTKWVRKKA